MQPDSSIIAELVEQGYCLAEAQWERLHEGAINQNYVLRDNDTPLFLKCFAKRTPARIDRERQYRLQQQLATEGFAPEPLYLGREGRFMLEPWYNLTPISQSQTPRDLKIAFLARRLCQIHSLTVTAPELDLMGDWQHYLSSGASLNDEQRRKMAEYKTLWASLDKTTLCHHDLAFSHVCTSPRNMTLDWEYAALSHPAFDIASCIWINELSEWEAKELAKIYGAECGKSWRPIREQALQLLPLADFTAQLWLQVAGLTRQQVIVE